MNSDDAIPGELTFEEAFARLEAAVARLESTGLSVDELVAEFEAGMGLVKQCQRLLDAAQLRVSVLLSDQTEETEIDEAEELIEGAGGRT